MSITVEEKARLIATRAIPDFQPGDTLRVMVKIKEGERERIQAFEGVCIARAGGGVNENFTVRKISFGEGVERVFPILSPNIDAIEVKRRGVVRQGGGGGEHDKTLNRRRESDQVKYWSSK